MTLTQKKMKKTNDATVIGASGSAMMTSGFGDDEPGKDTTEDGRRLDIATKSVG